MGDSLSAYVAQYGDALRNLTNQDQENGTLGLPDPRASLSAPGGIGASLGGGVSSTNPVLAAATRGPVSSASPGSGSTRGALQSNPPPLSPQQRRQAAFGAQPSMNGSTSPALSQPSVGEPADPDSDNPHSFWRLADKTSDADKQKLVDNFEKQGIDVDSTFEKLRDAGQINVPLGKNVSLHDKGLFLFEFGLRAAQASAAARSKGQAIAGLATGALGTLEAARQRQLQTAQAGEALREKKFQEQMQQAQMAQTGKLADMQRQTQLQIAQGETAGRQTVANTEANARIKAAELEANARKDSMRMRTGDKTYVDGDTNKVYWLDSGEPVMVSDGKGGQRQLTGFNKPQKNEFSEKDVEGLVKEKEKELSSNPMAKITDSSGKAVTWMRASSTDQQAYLSNYAKAVRARAGLQGKQSSDNGGSSETNPYDRFDSQ